MALQVKRVYETTSRRDGKRVLVDRIWPRGLTKENAQLDEWLKELAPSTELRQWYGHRPEKWNDFKRRYFHELEQHTDAVDHVMELTKHGMVTLLFSSREPTRNNAVALMEYLQKQRPH